MRYLGCSNWAAFFVFIRKRIIISFKYHGVTYSSLMFEFAETTISPSLLAYSQALNNGPNVSDKIVPKLKLRTLKLFFSLAAYKFELSYAKIKYLLNSQKRNVSIS